MHYLTNIPLSIFNNLLLMGILWISYSFVKHIFKIGTKQLFLLAVSIQIASSFVYLFDMFYFSGLSTQFSITSLNQISSYFEIQAPRAGLLICFGGCYFLGLLCYFIHFVYQLTNLSRLKKTANYNAGSDWLHLLSNYNLELPAQLKIGMSDKISSPMIFGFIEPIILLPFSICNQLNEEEIKLILLHEIAHLIRQDYIINLIVGLSKVILWFNPFSYLIGKEINLLREIACDEFVIEKTNKPIVYSKALFQLATANPIQKPLFSMGAINNNGGELLLRIKQLNKLNTSSSNRIQFNFPILFLIAFSFIGMLYFSNQKSIKKEFTQNANLVKLDNKVKLNPSSTEVVRNSHPNSVPKKFTSTSYKTSNIISSAPKVNELLTIEPKNEDVLASKTNFDALLNETRTWIKQHENPSQFATYSNATDSIENVIAERLLMSSIVKSYKLKRAIMEQKLADAKDMTDVIDYFMKSQEWDEIAAYEKWAQEYLVRHQQRDSLPASTTKKQIQYR